MVIKLACVVISILIASYIFQEGAETDFQPYVRTRILLFCSGFVLGLCVGWLAISGSFWKMIWLKLIISVVLGFASAFALPKRWRFMQKQRKSKK